MGWLNLITGRNCNYPMFQENATKTCNVVIHCLAYCKSTDSCLKKYYVNNHNLLIYKIMNNNTFLYSSRMNPNELREVLGDAWDGLCPNLKVPAVEDAIRKKQQDINYYMVDIGNYIVNMSNWLLEEINEFNKDVEIKRNELLEDKMGWYENSDVQISIDDGVGSELYYYKFNLYYDIRNRLSGIEVENPIASCADTWFSEIVKGIFVGEMHPSFIEAIRQCSEYHKDVFNSILKFTCQCSLEHLLSTVRESR